MGLFEPTGQLSLSFLSIMRFLLFAFTSAQRDNKCVSFQDTKAVGFQGEI